MVSRNRSTQQKLSQCPCKGAPVVHLTILSPPAPSNPSRALICKIKLYAWTARHKSGGRPPRHKSRRWADQVAVAAAALPGPEPAKAASILERRRSSLMVALAKPPPNIGKAAARYWQSHRLLATPPSLWAGSLSPGLAKPPSFGKAASLLAKPLSRLPSGRVTDPSMLEPSP